MWIAFIVVSCLIAFVGALPSLKDETLKPSAATGLFIALIVFVSGFYIVPKYNVWEQGLVGEAELAKAEQNRQILINEAKAKKESSIYWAEAEIERSKGAAEANKIMANSLGGSEDYLRWLFIEKLDEINNGQIIYLPTEAGVPVLEANRLK